MKYHLFNTDFSVLMATMFINIYSALLEYEFLKDISPKQILTIPYSMFKKMVKPMINNFWWKRLWTGTRVGLEIFLMGVLVTRANSVKTHQIATYGHFTVGEFC